MTWRPLARTIWALTPLWWIFVVELTMVLWAPDWLGKAFFSHEHGELLWLPSLDKNSLLFGEVNAKNIATWLVFAALAGNLGTFLSWLLARRWAGYRSWLESGHLWARALARNVWTVAVWVTFVEVLLWYYGLGNPLVSLNQGFLTLVVPFALQGIVTGSYYFIEDPPDSPHFTLLAREDLLRVAEMGKEPPGESSDEGAGQP